MFAQECCLLLAENAQRAALTFDTEWLRISIGSDGKLMQFIEKARELNHLRAESGDHLGWLRRAGRQLDVGRLLGQGRVDAIRLAARGTNGDMAAVRRRLPFTAPLAEIRLALEV